ncbi:MAG: GGDEF domain-containing protein [Gammaproteobacteria bacterium]
MNTTKSPYEETSLTAGSLPFFSAVTEQNLGRALAASRREVAAARAELDGLLERDLRLKRRVGHLERALVTARQQGCRDALTGLANRRLLGDHYRHAVARAARRHLQVGVLFLDLDGFRAINTAIGHDVGDKLLQQVAIRLTDCIRPSDTACRPGGDEFAILLLELESREVAVLTASRVRACVAMPYVVNGSVTNVSTSVGMAVYPLDGQDCDELLRPADREMYRDKAASR